MKKISSLILAALLVAALFAIPLNSLAKEEASEPVGISDAAGFAAMETGGSYYLTANITVSETHTAAFAGTFDGKGFTITTTAPLFDRFEGTAKDLTIEGTVTSSADRGGAFCNTISGETTLSGIVNKAAVNGSTSKVTFADALELNGSYGGIYGTTEEKVPLTIENCVNYGKITGYTAGGISGKSNAILTMKNCKNFGDVVGTDVGAGLIAWTWGDFLIEDCANGSESSAPDITAESDAPGGIISYISGSTNGTCRNCVNWGTVHSTDSNAGGIVGRSGDKGDQTYENCVNYGNIVSTKSDAGGIFGATGGAGTRTFKNCVNRGKIYTEAENADAGGIVGFSKAQGTRVYEGCVNYAEVEGAHVGGIAGNDRSAVSVSRCANYGEIKGRKQAAGIIGSLGDGETSAPSSVEYCANEGKITATKDTAGGIIAYANGSTARTLTIKACYNTADVTGGCEASGILGYINGAPDTSVTLCFNTGKIASTDSGEKPIALYYNKAEGAKTKDTAKGNFYLAGCAEKEARNGADYLDATGVPEADFKSGKVCYEINQAAGEEIFFQTIGTDPVPTFSTASARVLFENGEYKNPSEPAPSTDPVTPPTPPTGDSAVIFVAVAIVSVIGTAVAVKIRKGFSA